jgi:hypothetical protein
MRTPRGMGPRETDGARVIDLWDDHQLDTSAALVYEDAYPSHSKLLGPDGKPIPYESPKLGFIGYIKLR